LKTFLTQIGSTLPLTSDPPVICFWKWIGWKDYEVPKNHNLESVSVKNELFFSPTRCTPTLCTHLGPLFPSPRGKKFLPRRCRPLLPCSSTFNYVVVTPDFPKKIKCISYVCQDQVYTHMIDVMSEISINNNKNVQELNHYIIFLLHSDVRLNGLYNDQTITMKT
jgi:hypothetical protein